MTGESVSLRNGGIGRVVKEGESWSKGVDAAHMAALGMGGSRHGWVGVKPSLADSRRTSTASDQESLSVQSWSMSGSGWSPDSTHVHSISDDDLVGKVGIASI